VQIEPKWTKLTWYKIKKTHLSHFILILGTARSQAVHSPGMSMAQQLFLAAGLPTDAADLYTQRLASVGWTDEDTLILAKVQGYGDGDVLMGYLSALGSENLAELADLADMQPMHATRLGLFAEKALRFVIWCLSPS
jgi:hypothetical protein